MKQQWRIINSGSAAAERNMAIDEALLQSFDSTDSLPVLRFYGWNPAALSFGRFQNPDEILLLEKCLVDKTPLVRRITGGGVIYHADEITYSIVCSPQHLPQAVSIKDTYRLLTAFLLSWYEKNNIEACYARDLLPQESLGEHTAYCFAGLESFDIIAGGKKIGGNAQRRTKKCIFQHGSIPIRNMAAVGLCFMQDQNLKYANFTTSLEECGVQLEPRVIVLQLADMFCNKLGIAGAFSQLTTQEECLAEKLVETKYTSELWNIHGGIVE